MPSLECPADRTAPSKARRFVADTLHSWGIAGPTSTDAVLLVSELVTNALLHARSAPTVELTRDGDRVRVGVSDASPVLPRRRQYANDAATGRGIALVDQLASDWGSERVGDGKRVWFEVLVDDARHGEDVHA